MHISTGGFRIVPRPRDVESSYSLLVVDQEGLPHLILTDFYAELEQGITSGAARTYLNVLLPYFSWLAITPRCRERGDRWDSSQESIQISIRDYLRQQLGCLVDHRDTYEIVKLTAKSPQTVRVFLAALKKFYSYAIKFGRYPAPHPLKERTSDLIHQVQEKPPSAISYQMPSFSGIEVPPLRYPSENYFRLVQEQWVPTTIDDPDLHRQLLAGATSTRLCLRDWLIVRIAYESGARISEILGLTIGDWRVRGFRQEAVAASKGSGGRRVKFLRFSPETVKLLHHYVEGERKTLDSQQRGLHELTDLDPLFLSRRRRAYRYQGFVPHWKALCQAAGITLRIHGLRHWHTTQAMRWIYETTSNPVELHQRKSELVRYMAWHRPETLIAYDHYFQISHYLEILDQLHQQFDAATPSDTPPQRSGTPEITISRHAVRPSRSAAAEPAQGSWDRLLALGGRQEA